MLGESARLFRSKLRSKPPRASVALGHLNAAESYKRATSGAPKLPNYVSAKPGFTPRRCAFWPNLL